MVKLPKSQIDQVIHGRTDIHIGKNGITSGVVKEIKKRLKKQKLIKVRFLDLPKEDKEGNVLHSKDAMKPKAKILSNKTNSHVVDIRGMTCVLQKR